MRMACGQMRMNVVWTNVDGIRMRWDVVDVVRTNADECQRSADGMRTNADVVRRNAEGVRKREYNARHR